ncbi:SDR family NAD(P)-dependent oxidoreductase [Streptomyces sp. NBC_01643]|uniref:SDR family oxidoreductase n=1 Tax=Streptomyces sp. NBC_01643 TaxID=2975906 RepID=UPI002F90CE28|nr:SDR family oxidoreductase [Streptomyces sp. NBC_01643]
MNLKGKTAVVTGSGQGLGLAYARALAAAGADVVVNDIDEKAADAAALTITEAGGGRAVACTAAVGTSEAAQLLVDTAVEAFGRLDVMVTNAGVLRDRVLWKMSDKDFCDVVRVHLDGTFLCVRAAVDRMREQGQGGRIICVGSPTGQFGNFGQTNYAAAKAGIVGMVRTWALELARAQITANAIVPVAATAMTATMPAFADHVAGFQRGEPLPDEVRRQGFGTPADAAALVAFLASDEAAGINGQAIGIGGDRLTLWSHPVEVAVRYRDGGWSPDAIAEAWPQAFADSVQHVGPPVQQEA